MLSVIPQPTLKFSNYSHFDVSEFFLQLLCSLICFFLLYCHQVNVLYTEFPLDQISKLLQCHQFLIILPCNTIEHKPWIHVLLRPVKEQEITQQYRYAVVPEVVYLSERFHCSEKACIWSLNNHKHYLYSFTSSSLRMELNAHDDWANGNCIFPSVNSKTAIPSANEGWKLIWMLTDLVICIYWRLSMGKKRDWDRKLQNPYKYRRTKTLNSTSNATEKRLAQHFRQYLIQVM